jgi:hypothetical protein
VSLRDSSNNELRQIPPRNDISRAILVAGGRKIVTGLPSGAIALWNGTDQSDLRSLPLVAGRLTDLQASRDGSRILGLDDKGNLSLSIPDSNSASPTSTAVADSVNSFFSDASARTILLRTWTDELDMVDLTGNQPLRKKFSSPVRGKFEYAVLRPDGKEVAMIEDNTLRFIDSANGNVLRPGRQLKVRMPSDYPRSLMYSARGDVLFLWEHHMGLTALNAVTGEALPVAPLSISPDWDLTRYSVASPDDQSIAARVYGSGQQQDTWLWNFRTGSQQKIATLDFPGFGIGFNDDGTRLLLLDRLPFSNSGGFTLSSVVLPLNDRLNLGKKAAASMTTEECKEQLGKPECPNLRGQ